MQSRRSARGRRVASDSVTCETCRASAKVVLRAVPLRSDPFATRNTFTELAAMNHANECRSRYSTFRSAFRAAIGRWRPASRRAGQVDLRGAISEILLIRKIEPASRYWNSYDGSPSLFPLAVNTRPFTLRANVRRDRERKENALHVTINAQKPMELKRKNRARLRLITRDRKIDETGRHASRFSFYCPLDDGWASEKLYENERTNL